jgi:hypothetical protein
MDITRWYPVSLEYVVVLPIITRLLLSVTTGRIYGAFYLRKYLVYPQMHRHLRRMTRLDLFAIFAFLIETGLCLGIGINGVPEFLIRSGLLSINPISLSLRANMDLVVSACGISLSAYEKRHR